MSKAEIEKKAFDYFNTGYCCAEALSKTIIDHFALKPENYPINVATGFCGGVGRTHADLCGAVAGAVLAVGYLYGRTEQGKDFSQVSAIISEFRKQFIEALGSTNCALILESLGEQEKYIKCKQLTGRAAGMLYDILVEAKRKEASRKD